MKKNISIKSAKYLRDYEINFTFNDGTSKICDFKEFLNASSHPEIRKYLKTSLFKKFKIEHGDIMWGDFDLIFPIKDIYENELSKAKNIRVTAA